MANIDIRKDQPTQPTRAIAREWDPFRMMQRMMGWDPFRDAWPTWEQGTFAPAFDVKETKEGFLIKADVPGVKESDLEVRVSSNRLTVSGKREEEKHDKSDTHYAYERSFGSFTRTFTMPEGANLEAVVAELKDGVLSINVPKKAEMQSKKIEVKTPGK
jgi:HSP20 family protein